MSTNGQRTKNPSEAGVVNQPAGPWTAANLLTFLRIALMFPFLYLVSEGRFGLALSVFFLASLTDFADGYVARRYNQESNLGRFLDPLADKLVTTAAFVVMAVPHAGFPSIPAWLAAAVVGRDLVIVLGALVIYQMTRYKDFKPTLLGKINTLVELGLIVWFLVFHTTGKLIFLLPFLYLVVLASVIISGVEYIVQGLRILGQHRKRARTQ
jgi:cardiolipin synthase (CMP-forming)